MNTTAELSAAEDALLAYEALVQPARDRFAAGRGIRGMCSSDTDRRTMAAFLVHFSALSVPITEPVEGWIRRAGERCEAIGLPELGKALKMHSKAEAGHHMYHVNDFAALSQYWNARWSPKVDTGAQQWKRLTGGGETYCRVHEDNIAGPTPYCQLAIEYEIELLPVKFGSSFVDNCISLLGDDVLTCMTFVTSHIEFDVGHTKFNARHLGEFIASHPERRRPLALAGAAALDAFGEHLNECMDLAHAFGSR